MAFSGDHPVYETILYDVSGSAIALPASSSILSGSQAGVIVAGVFDNAGAPESRLLKMGPFGEVYVTGSLTSTTMLSQGDSPGNPLYVSGSVTVSNELLNVTGSMTLNNEQLNVTGSVTLNNETLNVVFPTPQQITGSVTIESPVPLNVTGSVSLTQAVDLTRGDSQANGLFVTGTLETTPSAFSVVSGGYYPANTTTITLMTANTDRRCMIIHNDSNKVMYVKFGSGASTGSYTFKIFSDDTWESEIPYTGLVTGIWAGTSPTGGAATTQINK